MGEVQRIRDLLDRAFHGDAWHGPSLAELLAGVDARRAAARPLADAHTIWELVHHLTAWNAIVRQRIEGTEPPEVTAEVDWPPVLATSASHWKRSLQRLGETHAALEQTIAGLDAKRLTRKAPGSSCTIHELLLGTLQHDLYHAGQIALLKKAR